MNENFWFTKKMVDSFGNHHFFYDDYLFEETIRE